MTKTVVVTARISDPLSADLDRLAVLRDRSRAWLVEKAIAAFVRDELDLREALDAASADVDASGGKAHAVFMAELKGEFGSRRAA